MWVRTTSRCTTGNSAEGMQELLALYCGAQRCSYYGLHCCDCCETIQLLGHVSFRGCSVPGTIIAAVDSDHHPITSFGQFRAPLLKSS
jgi:hypothetical protein